MSLVKILAFAGSTRKDSFNKKLAAVAARTAEKAGAQVTLVDLADYRMPLYDGDLESESGLPEAAARLKRLMAEHDGLLIAAPEYNGSITAVLKNTIDWLSRPGAVEGSVFQGKVATLMSASPGGLGGLRGLVHVRAILTNLGVLVLPGQQAVSGAGKAFDDEGNLDESNQRRVDEVVTALVETLGRLTREPVG